MSTQNICIFAVFIHSDADKPELSRSSADTLPASTACALWGFRTCTDVLLKGIPSMPRGRLDGIGP